MVITYHGLEFFKIQFGNTVLAFNPPSTESKYKSLKFGADVVLQSMNNTDFSGGELLAAGGKDPFIINGPGEYEVSEVFVRGFSSTSHYGSEKSGEELINTVYLVALEGMNICFLGALDSPEIDPKMAEALDVIDILFVPIGGGGVMTSAEAYKLAVKLESSIIIPMHYDGPQDPALQAFLKEQGNTDIDPLDKLTIKPKDLVGKQGEVIVLNKS